ncbi:MAG TPA: hypothetical protein VE007_05835 [Thermoanaerobaculia bacterium]|nr:hypothetical protein [Thermoanaerobaculia bacterium]
MVPSAARAAERLLGGAAASAAGAFRATAFAAMLVCLVVAALQVRRALAASKTRAPGPRPALFAAANALLAAAALAAAAPFRIADSKAPPLAAIAGSWGYLFFAGFVLFLAVALAPGRRGAAARIGGGVLAAACLPGALVLLFFTRAADPPLPLVIGTLWQTPSALYVSSGDRGRRESDGAAPVEADLVEARSALFGLSRQGLAGFRSGGRTIPWRGDGGLGSRIAAHWPAALSGALFSVQRSARPVEMRPNERIWILRGPDGIAFSAADAAPAAPDLRRPE